MPIRRGVSAEPCGRVGKQPFDVTFDGWRRNGAGILDQLQQRVRLLRMPCQRANCAVQSIPMKSPPICATWTQESLAAA